MNKDLAYRSLEYAGDEPAMANALVSSAQVYATLAVAVAERHDE